MTPQDFRKLYMRYYRAHTGYENYGRRPIPCWDGGVDRFGKRYKNFWEKLKNFIEKNNLTNNAEQYIHAQFLSARGGKPPLPNQLISDSALKNYHGYRETVGRLLTRRYTLEKSIFDCEFNALRNTLQWEPERCVRRILKDVSLELSSFFRYCKAKSLGLDDLADMYFEQAKSEYFLCRRFYDAVYSDIVPDELKDSSI